MAYLKYVYKMEIGYESNVSRCYFTLKSIPANDLRQTNRNHKISIYPNTRYEEGADSFGNKQIYGCEDMEHDSFLFEISGLVETEEGFIADHVDRNTLGMYKYPHGKCVPGEYLQRLDEEISNDKAYTACNSLQEKCRYIMDCVSKNMKYESGSTKIQTTAEEAWYHKKGVCQDYAHILITIFRMKGIPARYVCGFIMGEGESHAWVEAVCDGYWIGLDPTYNTMITDKYIKTGVGRDAADCSINKGIMWGGGNQTQKIDIMVENYM